MQYFMYIGDYVTSIDKIDQRFVIAVKSVNKNIRTMAGKVVARNLGAAYDLRYESDSFNNPHFMVKQDWFVTFVPVSPEYVTSNLAEATLDLV